MQMEFGLYQEQTQKLLMTTQMKQAIDILQYSAAELDEYVEEMADANPCMDFVPTASPTDVWAKDSRTSGSDRGTYSASNTIRPLEQTIQDRETLASYLEAQVGVMSISKVLQERIYYLIGCVDERGYLQDTEDALCSILRCTSVELEDAVRLLQSCEPLGIGARNLQECLLLQISRLDFEYQDTVRALILHHLNDIAHGRFTVIAKALHLPVQEAQAAVFALKSLTPKPGLSFAVVDEQYVIPDIIVEHLGDDYVVLSNERATPRVTINHTYQKLLNTSDSDAKDYVTKKLQSAQWMIRCIEQRRVTLTRVAEAIVAHQQGFFHYGAGHMRPLTLHQIAQELELHESTISRATRGKYMQTPKGMYEMKYFFTTVLGNNSGSGGVSSESAKHAIRNCIQVEDESQPLSDDAIVKLLDVQGIQLSRRTVAKYREELGIVSSAKRRIYR